jgi:hypothetical protein
MTLDTMNNFTSTGTVEMTDGEAVELDDEELCVLALAADPSPPLGDDAISVWTALGIDQRSPLPLWYMPPATGGSPARPGWRRRAAVTVIVAFLTINAYGLCNTYGDILSR